MRLRAKVLSITGALFASVLAPASAQPSWDAYDRVSQVQCRGLPVLLQGSHTDVRVMGPCQYVRVAGEHNDIAVELVPGGTIEITGAHNDVSWASPGGRPQLLDRGEHNTFHHGISD